MIVEKVHMKNFRNYATLAMSFDGGVHLFSGFNAQGKTNLLEAIFLSAMGKSFRTGHDEELIGWEASESSVDIVFSNKVAVHELSFLFLRGEGRENKLNGRIVRKKDIIGLMNAVLFSPEDLWLVKGNPSARRRFIDFELSQSDPLYYHDLIKYNRVLIQRNQLLKKINEGSENCKLLEPWDDQLISLAVKVVLGRIRRIKRLNFEASMIHGKVTGGAEEFSARYFIFGENNMAETEYEEKKKKKTLSNRTKDIMHGTTDFGPHKDDIIFLINGHDAKTFASQGQQRTIVLALKMAEIEIMKQITGEYPVLLLDDVMSELDGKRKEKLIESITGKVQTFITGTEEMDCLRSVNHNCYYINDGHVYSK